MSDEITLADENIKTETTSKKRFIDANPKIAEVYNDTQTRFKVVCSGRQVGKTTLAIEELIRTAVNKPNSISYAVAPTMKMVDKLFKAQLHQRLYNLGLKFSYRKSSKVFTLQYPKNNSTITLTGVDDPDKLRGLTIDFVAIDEYDYMERRVWFEIFLPALAIKQGKAIFTSTPRGNGQIKELYEIGQSADIKYKDYKSWLFKSIDSPFMPKEEVAMARATMDKNLFEQEYEGSFETNAIRVARNFDRFVHIKDVTFNPNFEICVGCDFNVDPMAWVAFQIVLKSFLPDIKFEDEKYTLQNEVVVFLKEWKTANCNTEMQCELLKMWLKEIDYKGDINFYGDSSGNSRNTGQSVDIHSHKFNTDWNTINNEFENAYCYHNKANPIIKNRVNAANAKFLNVDNQVGILIDSICQELIRDFIGVSWNDEGKLDKSKERKKDKIGHLFDAATYPIYYEFDLNIRKPTISFI